MCKITVEKCGTNEEREAIIRIISSALANAKSKKQYLPVREEFLGEAGMPPLTAPWCLVVIAAERTAPVLDQAGERVLIIDQPMEAKDEISNN
jgi:hypothetical protein